MDHVLCFSTLLPFLFLVSVNAWTQCPPPGFDALKYLDVEDFISHSWYVQEQTVVAYQAPNSFYCVVATYAPKNKADIFDGLIVYNYANLNQVNGQSIGSSGSGRDAGLFSNMEAIIPDKNQPSKLMVGLSVLRSFAPLLYGPYWVVAAGTNAEGKYAWAIVSGGAPEIATSKGCRTARSYLSRFQVNGVGLWLFSRKPVDPENTAIMRKVAIKLGFDIDDLMPVEQMDCLYDGAVLK
eukprot:g6930.t1